jgi:Protein of unknown function (DUF2934)
MATRRVPESAKTPRPAAAAKKAAKATPVKAAPKVRKRRTAAGVVAVTEDQRRGMIATSAYLRGERRGFASGGEKQDWLQAEQEVDALLNSGQTPAQ